MDILLLIKMNKNLFTRDDLKIYLKFIYPQKKDFILLKLCVPRNIHNTTRDNGNYIHWTRSGLAFAPDFIAGLENDDNWKYDLNIPYRIVYRVIKSIEKKKDRRLKILKKKFWNNKTSEELAKEYNCDRSTIDRHIRSIIEKIGISIVERYYGV